MTKSFISLGLTFFFIMCLEIVCFDHLERMCGQSISRFKRAFEEVVWDLPMCNTLVIGTAPTLTVYASD